MLNLQPLNESFTFTADEAVAILFFISPWFYYSNKKRHSESNLFLINNVDYEREKNA